MDDSLDTIGAIYDAVGDVERWQHLTERLAAAPALLPEIAHHLEIARRAHEAQARLLGDIETLARVHDQLAIGALVVDGDARVLRSNAAAARLLADHAGLRLVGDRVEALDADENACLNHAIERASTGVRDASASQGPFILVTRPGRPPLPVVVLCAPEPIPHVFEDRRPVVLLLLDPDLTIVPGAGVLRALFGFTAREAELAALLMQGRNVEEAAHALGVTVSTARTFLAQLTAKTDSHTQAELVKHLLAIPHLRPRRDLEQR